MKQFVSFFMVLYVAQYVYCAPHREKRIRNDPVAYEDYGRHEHPLLKASPNDLQEPIPNEPPERPRTTKPNLADYEARGRHRRNKFDGFYQNPQNVKGNVHINSPLPADTNNLNIQRMEEEKPQAPDVDTDNQIAKYMSLQQPYDNPQYNNTMEEMKPLEPALGHVVIHLAGGPVAKQPTASPVTTNNEEITLNQGNIVRNKKTLNINANKSTNNNAVLNESLSVEESSHDNYY